MARAARAKLLRAAKVRKAARGCRVGKADSTLRAVMVEAAARVASAAPEVPGRAGTPAGGKVILATAGEMAVAFKEAAAVKAADRGAAAGRGLVGGRVAADGGPRVVEAWAAVKGVDGQEAWAARAARAAREVRGRAIRAVKAGKATRNGREDKAGKADSAPRPSVAHSCNLCLPRQEVLPTAR